jgi:hypothetical protein
MSATQHKHNGLTFYLSIPNHAQAWLLSGSGPARLPEAPVRTHPPLEPTSESGIDGAVEPVDFGGLTLTRNLGIVCWEGRGLWWGHCRYGFTDSGLLWWYARGRPLCEPGWVWSPPFVRAEGERA